MSQGFRGPKIGLIFPLHSFAYQPLIY